MSPRVARNSREGATIKACKGRKQAPTVQASASLAGNRFTGCAIDDISLSSTSLQNHGNRLVQNLEVAPQGPLLDVFQIECQPALKGRVPPRRHLPQTGKPRRNVETLEVANLVAFEIVDRMRTRAYQAHFSSHDVPQLRQLIQAVATEEATHACNARIIRHLEERSFPLVAETQAFF